MQPNRTLAEASHFILGTWKSIREELFMIIPSSGQPDILTISILQAANIAALKFSVQLIERDSIVFMEWGNHCYPITFTEDLETLLLQISDTETMALQKVIREG